jgi:hypothetical protein
LTKTEISCNFFSQETLTKICPRILNRSRNLDKNAFMPYSEYNT